MTKRSVMESISRGVLDTRLRGYDDLLRCQRLSLLRRFRRALLEFRLRLFDQLQRFEARHRDDVVAGIDEMNFAGDATRKIGQKIKCRSADFFDAHHATQWRIACLETEHLPGIADH